MHLLLCLLALIFSVGLRLLFPLSFFSFVVPPLFLISTTIVILLMGWHGSMWMMGVGWSGYLIALFFSLYCAVKLTIDLFSLKVSRSKINNLPGESLIFDDLKFNAKILDHSMPFAGLVGCFNPQLVLSKGLIEILDRDQLKAVILHEEAHRYYYDPLYFFGLGYLKQITTWLPQTEKLWQKMLLERELRADRKASEQIDRFYIAESLLKIVEQGNRLTLTDCTQFYPNQGERLEIRIESLLSPAPTSSVSLFSIVLTVIIAFLPFFYLLFHR